MTIQTAIDPVVAQFQMGAVAARVTHRGSTVGLFIDRSDGAPILSGPVNRGEVHQLFAILHAVADGRAARLELLAHDIDVAPDGIIVWAPNIPGRTRPMLARFGAGDAFRAGLRLLCAHLDRWAE